MLDHVLVAQQQKFTAAASGRQPTRNILTPGSIGVVGITRNKARSIAIHRISIFDETLLKLKVVVGNQHVTGVAHNVDYLLIARVKGFVALDNAWPRDASQGLSVNSCRVGYLLLDISKGDWFVVTNKIGDQEHCPSVARPGIGNQEGIIRENREITASSIQTEQTL